jgi:tetratricopeptide (TPR) repeat protein
MVDQVAIASCTDPAYNEMGVQYLTLGQPDKAAEAFTKALKLAPEDFVARLNYGIALLNLNKFAEAEKQLRQTIIELRNETTVPGVVDKDQSRLPPYYHQPVVGEKHTRRNAATIRTAGGEHLEAGPCDLASVDRALFHRAYKESSTRLVHRHAFRVHIRAVKKRVQDGRRIGPKGLLRVAVRRQREKDDDDPTESSAPKGFPAFVLHGASFARYLMVMTCPLKCFHKKFIRL